MKINFKSIFGTTLVVVLVALLIFSLVGAPIVDWIKSKMPSTYDGTAMGFDGSYRRLSPAQVREELRRMRSEAADNAQAMAREVAKRVAA